MTKSGRGHSGLDGSQIEGRNAVRELLRAHKRQVQELYLASVKNESAAVAEIVDLARAQHVRLIEVDQAQLRKRAMSDAPQGVIAVCEPLDEHEVDDLLGVDQPFVLVLDHITDPHNFEALLRSAYLAGVTGVAISRHDSVVVTPSAAKAAAGAIEHIPIALGGGVPKIIDELKRAEVWAVGLDGDARETIYDQGFSNIASDKCALVLGSEGRGISHLVEKHCDLLVRIPQRGKLDSLNVSAAGAVAMFEVAHQRELAGRAGR